MATVGRAIRMGESSQGTQAQVPAAHEEAGQSSKEQVASRAVHPHSTGSLEVASSATTEPCARGRRNKSHRGGSEVGGSPSARENAHSKPLMKALEVARARSQISPVDKRIDSCKSFLERARKWAGRLEEVIARATTEQEVCLQEIAESERRLEQLEAQARVLPTQVDAQVEVSVGVLQEKIDVLQKAGTPVLPRPAPVWMRDGPLSLDNIPPLPSANVQDVEYWLNCHTCEMRNALEHGDVGTIARCGSLVAQGAAMLGTLSHDIPMNARSTLMTERGRL